MSTPRSFAGQRDATVLDFMTVYCTELSLGDDPAPFVEIAKKIARLTAKRGATDLGAWMRMNRDYVKEDLIEAGGEADWVLAIEDMLNMEFDSGSSTTAADRLLQRALSRTQREEKFKDVDDGAFGARMLTEDRLNEITFEYEDFPNMKTANPKHSVIKDNEFHYIKDTARACMSAKYATNLPASPRCRLAD